MEKNALQVEYIIITIYIIYIIYFIYIIIIFIIIIIIIIIITIIIFIIIFIFIFIIIIIIIITWISPRMSAGLWLPRPRLWTSWTQIHLVQGIFDLQQSKRPGNLIRSGMDDVPKVSGRDTVDILNVGSNSLK